MSNSDFMLNSFPIYGKIDLQIYSQRKKCQFFSILNFNDLKFNLNILDKEDNILHNFDIDKIKNIFNFKNLNKNSYKIKTDDIQSGVYILRYYSNTDYKDWDLDIIEKNLTLFNSQANYFGFLFSDSIFNANDREVYSLQLSPNIEYNLSMIDLNSSIIYISCLEGPELNSAIS